MQIESWSPSVEGLEFARKQLGRRLRERRSEAGLTLEAAAGVAGVSRATYARFEAGSAVIGCKPLRALAERYGCKMGELMPREQYLSAPRGAVERLAWVRERNRLIQESDRDLSLHARG